MKPLLDNGTLVTLGLVGVVAAVGAANKAGLYGSRALLSASGLSKLTDAELEDYWESLNPSMRNTEAWHLAVTERNVREYRLPNGPAYAAFKANRHSARSRGSRALRGPPHAGPSVQRMVDFLKIPKVHAAAVKARMDAGAPYQTLLEEADRLLNGNGVEYIQSHADTMRSQDGLSYVNMGDTYDTTLLYDHKTGRFSVGSWGDIVERQPRRFE